MSGRCLSKRVVREVIIKKLTSELWLKSGGVETVKSCVFSLQDCLFDYL